MKQSKAKQQEKSRYYELDLDFHVLLMQKRAKNAKPASNKINSMFWTTLLFVCHVLTNMVRVIEGKLYRKLPEGKGKLVRVSEGSSCRESTVNKKINK